LGAPVRGFLSGENFHAATEGKSSGRCSGKERILDYQFRIRISDQLAITFQAST
jgi:hypothetical protein